jgi:hypothetical protein
VRFSKAAVALAVAFGLVAPRPALATEEDAKTFFAEGRRLRMAGDCVNAVVSFRRALEIYPEGLGSLRNIAECEEQVGQFASARIDWWALRRAALASNEAKYNGWEKDAEAGYNRLKDKVGKLTIKLEGEHLERVRVVVDGKPLDPRLYGVQLERDLGTHSFEATYGGASPIVAKRELKEGGDEVVTLAIPSLNEAAKEAGAKGGEPMQVTVDKGASLRTGGFVALGVGVASLAAAGVSLGIRQSALGALTGPCPNLMNCPTNLKGNQSTGQVASILVDVFGGLGVVGVGVGTGLLVAGYKAKNASDSTAPTTHVSFSPLPGGAFARTEVTF